jgi:hypothetical protein
MGDILANRSLAQMIDYCVKQSDDQLEQAMGANLSHSRYRLGIMVGIVGRRGYGKVMAGKIMSWTETSEATGVVKSSVPGLAALTLGL